MATLTWELLLGPFAALVLALAFLYATFRLDLIVPKRMYDASETRCAMLEAESKELNEIIRKQTDALTKSLVEKAELSGEVKRLAGEVKRLTGETSRLAGEVQMLRDRPSGSSGDRQ